IGAEKTVTDAKLVGAAVVLVVADEDVQFVVERDVVNVSQAGGEHMQVAAVGPTTENAASVENQAISFGANDVAAVIAQGQVEPTVVSDRDAVGAVQPHGILFRG